MRLAIEAHYDEYHNVFVALSGAKVFTLWPPDATRALHLFPHVHPRARKSQIDLRWSPSSPPPPASLRGGATDGNATRAAAATFWHALLEDEEEEGGAPPLLDAAARAALRRPLRVTLAPGDALYVPPLWAHHVVSPEPCTVALNAFSTSRQMRALAALATVPLPLVVAGAGSDVAVGAQQPDGGSDDDDDDDDDDDATPPGVAALQERRARALLVALLRETLPRVPAAAFAARLRRTRWEPLGMGGGDGDGETGGGGAVGGRRREFACLTASHRVGVEEEEDAASVRPAARAVGRIVRRAFRTDGERELALQQYAEQLLNHVVGKLRIPGFLSECFPARLSGKKGEEKGAASARGTGRRRRRRRR